MNEVLLHTAAWMNVTCIILTEKSQTEKHNHTIQFYFYGVGNHNNGYTSGESNYRAGLRGFEGAHNALIFLCGSSLSVE